MLKMRISPKRFLAVIWLATSLVVFGATEEPKSNDASTSEETNQAANKIEVPKIPSFAETIENRVNSFCGYRVVKVTPKKTSYEVVFRNMDTKYQGYKYSLDVGKDGEIISHKPIEGISITGAIYCHTFTHSDDFAFFKTLGINSPEHNKSE